MMQRPCAYLKQIANPLIRILKAPPDIARAVEYVVVLVLPRAAFAGDVGAPENQSRIGHCSINTARAAELERTTAAGEPDRRAMALRNLRVR